MASHWPRRKSATELFIAILRKPRASDLSVKPTNPTEREAITRAINNGGRHPLSSRNIGMGLPASQGAAAIRAAKLRRSRPTRLHRGGNPPNRPPAPSSADGRPFPSCDASLARQRVPRAAVDARRVLLEMPCIDGPCCRAASQDRRGGMVAEHPERT